MGLAQDLDDLNDILQKEYKLDTFDSRYPLDNRNKLEASSADPESKEDKESRRTSEFRQWTVEPNECFRPAGPTRNKLESGVYTVGKDSWGLYFHKVNVITDNLINLPDTANEQVLEGMRKFWTRGSRYKEYGYLYKRGILLWGPPGGGKTATITMLSRDLLAEGGLVIFVESPGLTSKGLASLRRIEPDRPIVCIEEDIDEMISAYSEHDLLALLDGENQVDNIVHVACPAPETRILKADLTWVPAGELQLGDKLVAFDEFGRESDGKKKRRGARKLQVATVNSCPIIQKNRFRVKTSNTEIVVSERHPFLVRMGNRSPEWRYVEDLRAGNRVLSIGQLWITDTSAEAAYLSAQYDAEGSLNIGGNNTGGAGFRVRWAQAKGSLVSKTAELLNKLGYTISIFDRPVQAGNGGLGLCKDGTPHKPQQGIDVVGGKWEQLRFLGSIRPIRLLENPALNSILNGTKICPVSEETVISVDSVGYGSVVALDTTTKTFIGEGLLQHNTTNYPERLGARIINRPSRFDERIKIGMPSPEARMVYLKHTAKGVSDEELEKWVRDSEGFSVAHLRELTAAVLCLDQSYENVVERLKSMKYRIRADEGMGGDTGFAPKDKK